MRARSGLALEWVDDSQFFCDLAHRREYFLSEQARAGHPLLECQRSLCLEQPKDPRVQHFHDQAELGEYRLRGPDDDLQAVLRFLVGSVDFALRLLETDLAAAQLAARVLAVMVVAAFLELLAGEAEEAVVGGLARQTARGFLGIVARRQSPLRAGEVRGAAAEERSLTEF